MLIDRFDLNLMLKIDRKEQKYIQMIKEAFSHEQMKLQYIVSNYNVDLYFPQYRIAVECDEHGHSNRDPYYEQEREEHIKTKLSCVFLRFNPDDPCFSIFKVINSLIKMIYSGDDMYTLEQQIGGLKI
jgi:very-short-patch-repair endonuclease